MFTITSASLQKALTGIGKSIDKSYPWVGLLEQNGKIYLGHLFGTRQPLTGYSNTDELIMLDGKNKQLGRVIRALPKDSNVTVVQVDGYTVFTCDGETYSVAIDEKAAGYADSFERVYGAKQGVRFTFADALHHSVLSNVSLTYRWVASLILQSEDRARALALI